MRIAVASRDGETVSGHIGKCAQWIVYEVTPPSDAEGDGDVLIEEVERITLPKELIFHHYKDDRPHPLKTCSAVIGLSSGDNFKTKMQNRGIEPVMTAESDPQKAAVDYVRNTLLPPKPRPIGEIICKVHDAISRYHR